MFSKQDLTGQRYSRLLVEGFAGRRKGARMWICRCDCGTRLDVSTHSLLSGRRRSCGCLQREVTGNRSRTHGLSRTTEHKVWDDMKARCFNPNATGYGDYGGRGITVCERLGKKYGTVRWRLDAGWDVASAFGDTYKAKLKEMK